MNLRGEDGRTPLHIAADKGDPEKIALLLDHHADPRMQAATGATAMDIVKCRLENLLSAGGYNTKSDQSRLRMCSDRLDTAMAAHAFKTSYKSGEPGIHFNRSWESYVDARGW